MKKPVTKRAPKRKIQSILQSINDEQKTQTTEVSMMNLTTGPFVTMQFLKPDLPMLAKPVQFEDIDYNQNLISEIKRDGERLLVVVDAQTVNCYTRTLKPTKFKHPIQIKGVNAILDGERVYVDSITGKEIEICNTGHRSSLMEHFIIFDVIYYNSKDWKHKPLKQRLALLDYIVISNEFVRISPRKTVVSENWLRFEFEDVIQNGHEGLIVKNLNEPYTPGKRDWLKLKSLHIKNRQIEVELYLHQVLKNINGEYAILNCGYYDDTKSFQSVCKVGSGVSSHLKSRLSLMVNSEGYIKDPPLIVTLVCDQVTNKQSLRHPYFKRFRTDLNSISWPWTTKSVK